MKIIVSGLTAAGKTTHSQLLAEALDLEYVSASAALSQLATGQATPWSPAIDQARTREIDSMVDAILVSEFHQRGRCVFDAWGLPWLVSEEAVRVWIESDLRSRVWKAIVTELRRDLAIAVESAETLVRSKDEFSRELFRQSYGFDLYTDRAVFDVIVDNSEYISSPTIDASNAGIEAFHPVLMQAILSKVAT